MSEKETLRRLEELKKLKDTKYAEFKGMMKGIRLQKLTPIQDNFLSLQELVMVGFNSVWDELLASLQYQINTAKILKNLETKIEELETNILQLRQTLDKMVQDR